MAVPTVTLTKREVECVGPVFFSYWQIVHCHNENENAADFSEIVLEAEDDTPLGDFEPDDVDFLRTLDPKEWKNQDHYAVLGLKSLRYKATEEVIKRAYRFKVLHHHPDKRRARGEKIKSDDDYFVCITKAYDILGNPLKRRSYDSVDPQFDNEIPPINDHTKDHFYEVFGKVFDLNSRWSEKKPVPKLGNDSTTREVVEQFYCFWYRFQSWREFSYLDEEEKEQGQDREERKWIERQNKAVRAKRKKEEMARIRNLVDMAYNLDPRIRRFKQEDKDRKLAAKEAKKLAARARQEEEERKIRAAEEEIQRQKEAAEIEEKLRQEALKAEREAQKRAIKKGRSALRKLAKENNYFTVDASETVKHMTSIEKICECWKAEELEALVSCLKADGRMAFLRAVEETESRIEHERQQLLEPNIRTSGDQDKSKTGEVTWADEQLHLLIKALKLFPAGTNQRWEVVSNYINQHGIGENVKKTAKEVLAKTKDLQSSDYSQNVLKAVASKKDYENLEKSQEENTEISSEISQRYENEHSNNQWTAMEQQLLEQALKTYPATTPERWDRIAKCIPNRTKKDCIRRFKQLAEIVKAKKAAQSAVTSGEK